MKAALACLAAAAAALLTPLAHAQTMQDLVATDARQTQLLARAAASLPPQRPGVVDVYVLSVAGDGATNVFLSEARQALDILWEKLDAHGGALLSNDPATWATTPLASPATIAYMLKEIGRRADPEEDVVVFFLTAHGSSEGAVLVAPPSPRQIPYSGADLRGALDRAGVRHRAVIISACYSGVFVPPLANPQTVVITAARADRASFGCQAGRDWTYFGDAFFAHGLTESRDLEGAFAAASGKVAEWEKRDGLAPPSEPQLAMGAAFREKMRGR